MTRVAIIPARGGSKRIPRKNIKSFCGTPMLMRAIAAAQDSLIFDRIVVSTDCSEAAEMAEKSGAEVPFRRPAALSDDHTGTVDVIAHAIETIASHGPSPDAVCCLYPCTPFTNGAMLRNAFDDWQAGMSAYLFPICRFPSAPQRALKRDERGFTSPLEAQYETIRSQDLEPAFFDAGQFYWGHAEAWMARKAIHSHGRGFIVDWVAGVDIDTPEDWRRAELIFAAFHTKDQQS
jgi:pseudaminic acid cytidylyltransferase